MIISSTEAFKSYKKDPDSTPLVDVVDSFTVFVTHHSGSQGILDQASKAMLENEFGTSTDDAVIKKILQQGELQDSKGYDAKGWDSKNDSVGAAYLGH